MSISTTKTFGRITQPSLHGKIIHLSLQIKMNRECLKIGVNAVMSFRHPQHKYSISTQPYALYVFWKWLYPPSWFSSQEFVSRVPPFPLHFQKHDNRVKTAPEEQIHKSNTQRLWLPFSCRDFALRTTMIWCCYKMIF